MAFNLVPLVLVIVSLVLLATGGFILYRMQWFLQWLKGTAGLVLIALAVYGSVFALSMYTFNELVPDRATATLSFRAAGPQRFVASVTPYGGSGRDLTLQGDLWQLDLRVARWKGIFGMLGTAPGYQVHKLSGRYLSLEDHQSLEKSEHFLDTDTLAYRAWARASNGSSLSINAHLLSAPLMPMADGAIYEVRFDPEGRLRVIPLNGVAEKAISRWE